MDAVEQRDVELVRVKVGRTTRTAAAGRRLLVVATLGLSQVGHLKQCLHHSLRVGCLCDHLVQAQLEQAEVEIAQMRSEQELRSTSRFYHGTSLAVRSFGRCVQLSR